MARRGCTCGVCDAANQPAVCVACVNLRLAEKYKLLRRLSQDRDFLRNRVDAELKAKKEADIQQHWRVEHAERRTKLLESIHKGERLLVQNKLKLEKKKSEYEARKRHLDAASGQLLRRQKELFEVLCPDLLREHIAKLIAQAADVTLARRHVFRHLTKVFPLWHSQGDTEKSRVSKERQVIRICGACLPVRDDPHSVTSEDLSASLGYMVQLVYQAGRYLMAPMLHNAAFAASSSRIWQRTSYWDVHPVSRSEEYPLFLPRKGDRVKISSDAKPEKGGKLDSHSVSSGSSFLSLEKPRFLKLNSSDSTHDSDRDVKQALKLLKRSISCICVYGYTVLGLPMPSTLSTFEAFMELLCLVASKESRSRSSSSRPLATANNRADSSLLQSCFSSHELKVQALRMEMSDFFCIGGDSKKISESPENHSSGGDEWDVVETPILPPPSQAEDIEQWTRAMITDATKARLDTCK